MSTIIHPIIQFAVDRKTDPQAVINAVEKLKTSNSIKEDFSRKLHYNFENRFNDSKDSSLLGRLKVNSKKDEQLDAELRYFKNDGIETYTLVADSKNSNFDIGFSDRNPEALTGIFENMLGELAKIIKPAFSVNFFSEDKKQHYKTKEDIAEGLHRSTISAISTKPEDKQDIPTGLTKDLGDNVKLFSLTSNPFVDSTKKNIGLYNSSKNYFQKVIDRFLEK